MYQIQNAQMGHCAPELRGTQLLDSIVLQVQNNEPLQRRQRLKLSNFAADHACEHQVLELV